MRPRPRDLLLLTLLIAGSAPAQHEREAEIRGFIAGQATAWTAGNCKAYSQAFAPEGSFTNLLGMSMYGAPAFERRHCEILSGVYKDTRKVHTVRRIRFVTPDVVIVDIDSEIHGVKSVPDGLTLPSGGIVRSQVMEVLVRRDGQWWIEAYHDVDVKVPMRHAAAQVMGNE